MSSLPPPLEVACKDGNVDQVQQLLSSPPLSHSLSKAPTLLEIACIAARTDRPDLLTFCFDQQGFKVENDSMNSPLLHAANSGQSLRVFQVLQRHGWDLNNNCSEYDGDSLVFACYRGNGHLVRFLLENGADPNSDRIYGDWVVLTWAVAGNNASLQVLELLLDHGCRISETGALIAAAETGNMEATKLLIERGADLEEVCDYGGYVDKERESRQGTALFKACEAGQAEIVEYLLDRGSDPTFRDGIGRSPFSVAEANGHESVLQVLKGRGIQE